MRRPIAVALVALLMLANACAHTPTPEERAKAKGHHEIALSLVHEAQRAAGSGDSALQDLKWRHALSELLEGEKADPENSDLQYLLGMTYFFGFRRHADAERHLKRAIELKDGKYPEADNLLGTMLVETGRAKEAIVHLERARSNLLYATPYFAEQNLGLAKLKLERYDEAAAHFRAALSAQPDLCGAYIELARAEEARGAVPGARQVLDDFVTRCDSDRLREAVGDGLLVQGYYRLGMSHMKLMKQASDGQAHDSHRQASLDAFDVCVARFGHEPLSRECARSKQLLEVTADRP